MNVFLDGFRGCYNTDEAEIMLDKYSVKIWEKDGELNLMKVEKEQPKKEEFVTITDGFHKTCGSLKLKECWVTCGANSMVWRKEENIELIARTKNESFPFLYLSENEGRVNSAQFFKFRPFSPDNPPPVDWPLYSNQWDEDDKERHFAGYSGENCGYYIDGRSSINTKGVAYCNHPTFLNIEPVED